MSGFLTSLATLALGNSAPGAARLSLPSRFATATEIVPGEVEAREVAVGPEPVVPAIEPASPAAVRVMPLAEPRSSAKPQAPVRIEQAGPEPRRTATRSEPAQSASILPPLARPLPAEPTRPAATPSGRAPIDPPVDRQTRTVPEPALDLRGQRRIAETGTTAPSAPLSAVAVASRATPARDTRPVVNVTIDRIDVRAARDAPKPEAAPRRPTAQPSVSLADYLGGRS